MSIIHNVSPKAFSFSAIIVGYLLIDDLTANEQNALGNWLMLTAQVISTNAFYRQVLEERKNYNDMTKDDIIKMLNKLIEAILEGIDNLDK